MTNGILEEQNNTCHDLWRDERYEIIIHVRR